MVRRRIGYVGQNGGASDTATGRENLVLRGRLYGMRQGDARALVLGQTSDVLVARARSPSSPRWPCSR